MKYGEISSSGLVVRRRDKRIWLVTLMLFVGVSLFSFLAQRFKDNNAVDAASLTGFDPGYIISDYQMGNYNSMSEADIQAFLTAKNPCNNRDYSFYRSLSGATWHWNDGHFVCLSEERFGDGEVIGSGDTAAHIIWQTAQDYRINPQVLLVLLQKETGLITDPIPNNLDYRKATGFGCPDTAACSSKYYGFKNQLRNAAALFRTVLDGGWTNYPLGNNYIQYNPNAACGGSVVNIRSLATSALYRYTPYQPNAGALAAGYGTAYCGAYGNRNFYHYFEDWFGGIISGGVLDREYEDMVTPRVLYVKRGAKYVVPGTNVVEIRRFDSFEYFTHLNHRGNDLCLSIGRDKNCYLYSDLDELEVSSGLEEMKIPRMLILKEDTSGIDYKNNALGCRFKAGDRQIFSSKVVINNELCLGVLGGDNDCVPYDKLEELPEVSSRDMIAPRFFSVKKNAKAISISTGISFEIYDSKKIFLDKMMDWFGELCLSNSKTMDGSCILYSDLLESNDKGFEDMITPRYLKVIRGAKAYDIETGEENSTYVSEEVLFFNRKGQLDSKLCLSAYVGVCVKYNDLREVGSFVDMSVPRSIITKTTTFYYAWGIKGMQNKIAQGERLFFVDKIYVDGRLCLRTNDDANNMVARCVMYDDLKE